MKPILFFYLTLLSTSLFGQIDYSGGIEYISGSSPEIPVTWVKYASRDFSLYFDQWVSFINTENDEISTSRVEVTILHNQKRIQSFEFKVGESLAGHIKTTRPIHLKFGDEVIIHFKLLPINLDEKYVFSIFEKGRSTVYAPTVFARYDSKNDDEVIRVKPEKTETPSDELKRLRRNRTALALINLVAR